MNFKILAIAIITIVFLYNLLLSVVEMRSADNPIPENVKDVYDRDTYLKWRQYHAEKSRFGKLNMVNNKQEYIKELIREDISHEVEEYSSDRKAE